MNTLIVNEIHNNDTLHLKDSVIVENLLPREGYGLHLRQVKRFYDISDNSLGTSFTDIHDFPPMNNCKKNSRIKMDAYVPVRNDNTGWGGFYVSYWIRLFYIDLNITTEWISLGNSGHSTLMNEGDQDINHFQKNFWLDIPTIFPESKNSDFDIYVKQRGRAYTGTCIVRRDNDVNGGSDTNITTKSNHFHNEIILYEYSSIRI